MGLLQIEFKFSLYLEELHAALSLFPLQVDELVHQQKRACQRGQTGLRTATVAARVTT